MVKTLALVICPYVNKLDNKNKGQKYANMVHVFVDI